MSNLILTICSNRKREKGQVKQYSAAARKVADALPDMQKELYDARKLAFKHLKKSNRTGRFPAGRPLNEGAKHGPDIAPNSDEHDGHYMPALNRYDGRFYKEFKIAAGNVNRCVRRMKNDSENHLLIVSGLYGLLTPTEPIQKYSCDVTDEPEIKRLWKKNNLLTELVLSYMRKCGINRVFDFMADDSYRHLIDWELIKGNSNKVFYSRCENQTGPDMLSELGKAAGLLLSASPAQKLSEIEFSNTVRATRIKLVRKQPDWIPADSTFSDREKCMLWATRMETNISHFLDCYFINEKSTKNGESVSVKIRRFRNNLSLADAREHKICNMMKEIKEFRNDVVHNYTQTDVARKLRETKIDKTAPQVGARIPLDHKIKEIRTYYKETVKLAEVYAKKNGKEKKFNEPEDVDY